MLQDFVMDGMKGRHGKWPLEKQTSCYLICLNSCLPLTLVHWNPSLQGDSVRMYALWEVTCS